jgi:hypothetical protein
VESVLVRIDDDVIRVRISHGEEGLANSERRAAVREPDFNHHAYPFGDEKVAKDVSVMIGQRYSFEVPLGPGEGRTDIRELVSEGADPPEKLQIVCHAVTVTAI